MRVKQMVVIGVLSLVPSVGIAIGLDDVRRVTPANRPYIIEVGEPRPIGPRALDQERKRIGDLWAYTDFYGWPDYAEIQEIEPNLPWDAYEVRLYYLRRDREVAFGRAFISPAVTDFGVIKYAGPMSAATRDRIVALVTPPPSTASEAPERVKFKPVSAGVPTAPPDEIEQMVRRIEAAAERAWAAADNAAAASEAASVSADRTVSILGKLAK